MDAKPIHRYSREQILIGLRHIMPDVTGSYRPFDATTRIDAYLKATGALDGLDLLDLAFYIERDFGFRCSRDEWDAFFGCDFKTAEEWEAKAGSRFTFDHLADFIAERVEVVPLEPIHILAKACDTAGAFHATKTVARQVRPRTKAFGPSTPIRRILLGSKLTAFWNRLRWMTEDGIPPLRTTALTRLDQGCCIVAFFFGCLMFPLGAIIELLAGDWQELMDLPLAAMASAGGAFVIHRVVARLDNRLPDGVRTFGDLARIVAKSSAFRRVTENAVSQNGTDLRADPV